MLKKLISNELTKVLKQKGYLIILILLIVSFMVSPIITRLTYNLTGAEAYAKDMQTEYKHALEYVKEAKEYENKSMEYSSTLEAESIKYFIDNNYPEWKYTEYKNNFKNLYIYVRSYEQIQAGEIDPLYVDCYYGMSDEQMASTYNSSKAQLEALKRDIAEDTPEKYNLRTLESSKFYRDQYKAAYEDAKVAYETDSSTVNSFACEKCLVQYEIFKKLVEAEQVMYDTSAEPNSWRSDAFIVVYDCVTSIERNYPSIEEKDFIPATGGYPTYSDYVSYGKAVVEAYKETAYNYIYSAQNNIIVRDVAKTGKVSNKEVLHKSYVVVEEIMWIIFGVLGASMVAQEFSTGTARLLLIRPVSRSKILASKIIALLIIYSVVTIGSFILQSLILMIFYGVGDTFVSNVIFVFGKSVAVPSILSFLKLFVNKFVVTALYTLYAMMFAVLIKKTFVCVLIIYGIYSGFSLVATILNILRNVTSIPYWLNYTPIVFLEGVSVSGNLMDSSMLGILGEILGYNVSASFGYFHSWLGVGYFALLITFITFVTFKMYKKAQVVN